MLISLSFVVSVGLGLRLVMRPFDARLAWAAGAALGFALWLSMEALLLLAASFAVLTVTWLRRADNRARKNLWHALGLCVMVALVIAVERPPGDYLVEEYDRISIVHLAVALLALAFWAAVHGSERRRARTAEISGRLTIAGLGAVAAGAALYFAYPKFFGGPEVDVDPRLGPVFFDLVNELRPLWPRDAGSLGRFLTFLGPALICVPFLIALLAREKDPQRWDGWFYLAICLAVFLPLALLMVRFAPFTEVLLAVVLAELLGRLMALTERVRLAPARVVLRSGLLFGLLVGFIGLGAVLSDPAKTATVRTSCGLQKAYELLGRQDGLGARPRTVLAHFNYGPELLYRTPHAVVASPYHRNVAGLLDSDRIFGAHDDTLARRLIDERGIELVLLCPNGPALAQASSRGQSTFVGRLDKGRVPSWLRPVPVPPELSGAFRLYEVVR
jgi:predicted outer membrane lipoprotein